MLKFIGLVTFKSFHKASAPLKSLTLVVGTNASGKSNLREALRFLHGIGLRYSLAEILGDKYGPGGILQWRGIRGGAREASFEGVGRFGIRVDLKVPEPSPQADWLFSYRMLLDVSNLAAGPRVVREELYRGSDFVFSSHPPDDPLKQGGDHQIRVRYPRGGKYRNHGKTLEFSSARPVLVQLHERDREPVLVRASCHTVLAVLASMRFLDLDPDAIRQPSAPGQVILGDRGENLSSVLQSICADAARKETLLQWIRALTPMDVTDFAFLTDFTDRVMVHLVESTGFKVSALSASDGTLRFLALIAALLSADTGRIFFFEEFDNGIHPTRLHLLLELVQRACAEMDVQVIGTTHNPALLAFLDEEARGDALLVYRSEHAQGSKLRSVADLPDALGVLQSEDLGRLHQAGWLEDAAIFSEPEDEE